MKHAQLMHIKDLIKALKTPNGLSKSERIDLVFSSLFNIDKIQNNSALHVLTDDNDSDRAISDLMNQLEHAKNSEDPDTMAVRDILIEVIRNRKQFGLSKEMDFFFKPFLAHPVVAKNTSQATDEALSGKREWMIRTVLNTGKIGLDVKKMDNAQIFIDALRRGEYAIVANFMSWLNKKCDILKIRGALAADDILPLTICELARTDVDEGDLVALEHMRRVCLEGDSYVATNMLVALTDYVRKSLPVQIRIKGEYESYLHSPGSRRPDRITKYKNGEYDPDKYGPDEDHPDEDHRDKDISEFEKLHRINISKSLIVLNAQEASPDDIENLLEISRVLIQYIEHLEKNKPNEYHLEGNYTNCLEAAYTMLKILQEQGIKSHTIPQLINQMLTIAKNISTDVDQSLLTKLSACVAFAKVSEFLSIVSKIVANESHKDKPEDLEILFEVSIRAFNYCQYLEKNPPEDQNSPTYTNRLKAAKMMISILKKDMPIAEILNNLKVQVGIIENNKPGFRERGFLFWLRNIFDAFKPQMSRHTSEIIQTINSASSSAEDEGEESNCSP